jgi:hypothetical protein
VQRESHQGNLNRSGLAASHAHAIAVPELHMIVHISKSTFTIPDTVTMSRSLAHPAFATLFGVKVG